MRWMATLKEPIPNGDREKIYKVMMDETDNGTYIYSYVWPNNRASYDEWYVDKEEAMSAYANEIDENGWIPEGYFNILKDITKLELCFPKKLKSKVEFVKKQIVSKCKKEVSFWFQASSWKLSNGEEIFLPCRISSDDIDKFFDNDINRFFYNDEEAKIIIHCLMTRSTNGFIREKHLKSLLDIDYPEWCIPYIFELSTEYVLEILELIHNKLKEKDMEKFKEILNLNPKNFYRGYQKMFSYMQGQCGFQKHKYTKYVGYDLFKRKYGFTQEKDYRVKQGK